MQITLTPWSEALIRQEIEAGAYEDAGELIEEALRHLYDPQRLAAFRVAIERGLADPEDEDRPVTPELFEEIRRSARELAEQGHSPDPDVRP